MSFVLTSGGTAGHINPTLAVAAELTNRGKRVIFAGSIGGMEERLVHAAGLEYQAFAAKGFNRQNPFTLLSSSFILSRSTGKACSWLKAVEAEVVGAFGGYVSVPVGRAAAREHIPLLIHEQNSHMGWSNKYLSKHADRIALTYEAAGENLGADALTRSTLTGNPVRPEFDALRKPQHAADLRAEFRNNLGLAGDDLVLLVFGGSQGARHINQAIVGLAPVLMRRSHFAVVHLTGRKEFEDVQAALSNELNESELSRWKLIDYCDRMPSAFAAADIVLSRAGASSLAELAVAAKPTVLVPFPYATADHQRKNAESLVRAGAAEMVLDSELDTPRFLDVLLSLIDGKEKRSALLSASQDLQSTNAAAEVAELLIDLAQKR